MKYKIGEANILLSKVQFLQSQNNRAQIEILRLAMHHKPTTTKDIMIRIIENDSEIIKLMEKLVEDM